MADATQKLDSKLKDIGPKEDYKQDFGDIAKILMNECVLKKGETTYEIVEIEFYLFNSKHPDVITYPRIISAGRWFFHPSGVDLTFESNKEQFGGVLIRGIRNIDTGDLTLGPQKCVDLLWDTSDAFNVNKDEYPIIVEYSGNLDTNILNFTRWIPINSNIKKSDGERRAKEVRLNAAIERNKKIVSDKPYLGLLGIYDNIDKASAAEIMFNHRYRVIKSSIMNEPSWRSYSAKPKG